MAQHFPISKETFMRLDLPNLLINIWEYNHEKHNVVNCAICRKCEEWCIEAATIPHINSETNPPPLIINIVCKYLRQFLDTSFGVATLPIYCNIE